MRAKIIHVTNHAYERWIERVSEMGHSSDEEITEAVRKSKVVKKGQIIPYRAKRKSNTVYTVYKDSLFVLEPVSIEEFRLITVVNFNAYCKEYKTSSV